MKPGVIIDIVVVTIIWVIAINGYKKGLVKTVYGLTAFFLAAILASYAYEYVAEFLGNLEFVKNLTEQINQNFVQDMAVDSSMPKWMAGAVEGVIEVAGQTVAERIISIIISVLTVVLSFVLVKIVLGFAVGIIDAVMKLPILDTVNKTGGMLFGVIKGMLIMLICFAVVSMFVTADNYRYIHEAITDTYVARFFYDNNILMTLILR